MKITKISITILPGHNEERKPRVLYRDADKTWSGITVGDDIISGLYPHEIKLIGRIQEIIAEYNNENSNNK